MGISREDRRVLPGILRGAGSSLLVLTGLMAGCSTGGRPGGTTTAGNETNNTITTDDHTIFHVEGPVGGPFPNAQRPVVLTNTGSHPARWEADSTLPWLDFSKSQGTLDAGERERVTVSIDQAFAGTLPSGEYLATIFFRNQDNASDRIAIEFVLTVYESTGSGILLVTPEDDFEAEAQIGGDVSVGSKDYRMSNVGAEPLRFALSSSEAWLTFDGDAYGDLDPGEFRTVTLALDTSYFAGLGSGEHQAQFEFANVTNGTGSTSRGTLLTLTGGNGRVTSGLSVLFTFDEGSGSVVHDQSGVGEALDLVIADPSKVQWQPGSLTIEAATGLRSLQPAAKISQACIDSDELTVEAWIRPANTTQDGPARIVSVSGGLFERNFSLAQGQYGSLPANVFDARVRTTQTDQNGIPSQQTPTGSVSTNLTHLVLTRDASGSEGLYIDGHLVRQASVSGSFDGWGLQYPLLIGNEITDNRPWLGTLHLAAVYHRALSAAEVQQNYEAGTQDPGVGHLSVTPTSDYFITGTEGQSDFAPVTKTYVVSNSGTENVQWSASLSQPWVQFTTASAGELQPGASANVTIQIDLNRIQQFSVGHYSALANFVNETNGFGDSDRGINLTVNSEGGGSNGDKPGPHNTGPYDESILVPSNGLNITQNGAVYENLDINGSVTISANNVTLRNFRINGHGSTYGIRMTDNNFGIVIEDGELTNCDSAGIYGGGFTARRLELHEMGTDAIKTTRDAVVEYSWVHHIGMNVGAHADCNQTRQGSNFIFRYNNFDIPASVEPPYNSNATLIIQTAEGPIDNVLVEYNWLEGGNFTVYFENKAGYGHGDPTNCRLIGNRFGRDYRYGPLKTTGYVYITGNVWDDTGELMNINNE